MNEMEVKALLEKVQDEAAKAIKSYAPSKDYVKNLQDQVNHLETKMKNKGEMNAEGYIDSKGRKLAGEWIKAFVRKDNVKQSALETELKEYYWPAHVLHTGLNSNIDEGSLEQGAYLVPELIANEINRLVNTFGLARQKMRYMPFSGPGNQRIIPVELTGPTVEWVLEGGTKPKTKPTIGKVTQTLEKLAGMVIMTDDILEDSAIDLVAYCAQRIAEAIAEEEDRVYFAGDTLAGDPFDGVINAAGVVPVPMEVGAVGADIDATILNQAIYSIPTTARAGAEFYMHPTVFGAVQRLRIDLVAPGDGLGGYLVQQPANGTPSQIWGYNVVLSDALPTIDEAVGVDTPFMFFANLQKTCIYGDKAGLRVKLLDQASVYDEDGTLINLAERDMQALRVHKRTGYVPVLPAGISVIQTGPVS